MIYGQVAATHYGARGNVSVAIGIADESILFTCVKVWEQIFETEGNVTSDHGG